jgi:signal transduction histidine kinase/DNA-binding NarL/FixJ family response regulator
MRGTIEARFLLGGMASFFVGSVMYGLKDYALLPKSNVTEHGAAVGTAIEAILLSLGLAYRYRVLQARNSELVVSNAKSSAISSMVSAISHDVRKPLSILKLVLDGIKSARTEIELRTLTESALPELQSSMDSVEGLLQDVMQVGSDSPELTIEAISVEAILDSVLSETFRGQPDAAVRIDSRIESDLTLRIDTSKAKRIFANIITNACQAIGWNGHIWIHASRTAEMVHFTLGNSGSFIPQESHSKLFDAFFTSNKRGGTGLGLAIAKKWVEAHGGQIDCRSETTAEHPEGYVEFEFTLPAGLAHDKLPRPLIGEHSSAYRMELGLTKDSNSTPQSLWHEPLMAAFAKIRSGLQIGVCDDEPIYIEGITQTLKTLNLGDKVTLSTLSTMATSTFLCDLLLVDYDLGLTNRNGLDVIRDTRTAGSKALICLHTNRTDAATYREAIEAGADTVFPKPLSAEHLAKILLETCKRQVSDSSEEAAKVSESCSIPHKLRVAFVDDSLVMRLSWKRALADRLNLSLFASPEELFRSNKQFDVVVMEMNFDNSTLSGVDVAHWSRATFPSARVFLCSNEPMVADGLFDSRLCKERVPTLEELS